VKGHFSHKPKKNESAKKKLEKKKEWGVSPGIPDERPFQLLVPIHLAILRRL
jgi:hypothetical protein